MDAYLSSDLNHKVIEHLRSLIMWEFMDELKICKTMTILALGVWNVTSLVGKELELE